MEAIGLHSMPVSLSRGERNITDLIIAMLLQDHNLSNILLCIFKDDGILFEGIPWGKEESPLPEASVSHGLDHDVHIA